MNIETEKLVSFDPHSFAGVSSMVASTLTAWLLENTLAPATTAKWHAIPVINIPQHQLWQHRDAAWLFHVCGVDPSALLFVDEVNSCLLQDPVLKLWYIWKKPNYSQCCADYSV